MSAWTDRLNWWTTYSWTIEGEGEGVWRWRRVNTSAPNKNITALNDITIQNWAGSNDYAKQFVFLTPAETAQQRVAYGYHYWYRDQAPSEYANRTILIRSIEKSGTCRGLAKMPYLRGSRRSIGYQNFQMNLSTITNDIHNLYSHIFNNRMCIDCFQVDIHAMITCNYSNYITNYYPVLLYYVPLRAMTNHDIDNFIVIGKTMAQTFLINAAVRLHPRHG